MIHPRTLQALEFDKIIEQLAALCCSGVGRERALALVPLPDNEAVDLAVRLYEEAAVWDAHPVPGDSAALP